MSSEKKWSPVDEDWAANRGGRPGGVPWITLTADGMNTLIYETNPTERDIARIKLAAAAPLMARALRSIAARECQLWSANSGAGMPGKNCKDAGRTTGSECNPCEARAALAAAGVEL